MSTDVKITLNITAKELRSNASGFSRLAELHSQMVRYSNTTIHVDMSELSWMDGHLASALMVLIRRAERSGNQIFCLNTRPNVRNVLQRNKLFQSTIIDRRGTTMPVREFGLEQFLSFSEYAKRHLARPEMPKMTPALTNKFFEGVDELFANSALHSKAQVGVIVCGQFYPRTGVLDFAIVDGGISIPVSLRESGKPQRSDAAAIEWAMTTGHTTRQGDIPGGLGSKVLREFVGLNEGRLMIVSGSGLWLQNKTTVSTERLSDSFPGTIVVLEINTSDKKSYDLVGGPSATDIW